MRRSLAAGVLILLGVAGAGLAALVSEGTSAPAALSLHLVSQTQSKITLGWTPQSGIGYRFYKDGKIVSHTWDATRSEVTFSKATTYAVEVILAGEKEDYPPPITTTTTTQPTTTTTTQPTTTTTTTTTQPTTTTTTTPPPVGQFSGGFDCYGSGPNCPAQTPPGCTSTIAANALQSALNSATGGQVICLQGGSTGGISLTRSYSSDVTVQPASGASVSVGGVTLNNVDHLRFTGTGGMMSMNGTAVDASSGCSSSLTFDHITYTGGVALRPQFACSVNMGILFDHDRFDNLSAPGGSETGRFHIRYNSGTSGANGITVSNSSFNGGCADGVYMDNSPRGTVIGPGNEFTNIDQGYSNTNCGGNHVDPIGAFFDENTLVIGNWFHDNGSGSGGILNAGSPGMTVRNNVFASTGYPHSIVVKAAVNNTYTHNVFIRNVRFQDSDGGQDGSGNVVNNNVFVNQGIITEGTGYTASGNVGIQIPGPPIFVSSPASGYYHYQLAPGSPGFGSAGICAGC